MKLIFISIIFFVFNAPAVEKLKSYSIDPSQITISGISSGAFMDEQMAVSAIEKNLTRFDQSEFANAQTPLFANGWIYVPEKCAAGEKCGLQHLG